MIAHPDDEVIGLGSRLHLFRRLILITVTDGAPHDMGDARKAGFRTRRAYAAARRREQTHALRRLDGKPERRLGYAMADQTAVDRLPELVERLACDLLGADAVVTHPYEGGHPDHDACAFAVQAACARLDPPPARLEFAGYHGRRGRMVINQFSPAPGCAASVITLSPEARAAKLEALACFASQAEVVDQFPPRREALRPAPTYDFAAPPPPGEILYDRYGWPITGAVWRERAAHATAALAGVGGGDRP